MAVYKGIQKTYGITAPAGACVYETNEKADLDVVKVLDEDGEIKHAIPKELITYDVSMRGKGDPGFAAVVAGAFSLGVSKILSAKSSQVNSESPDFELSAKKYDNLSDI